MPARLTARASASRRAALRTKCHALLLRRRLAMVKRTWRKTVPEPGEHTANRLIDPSQCSALRSWLHLGPHLRVGAPRQWMLSRTLELFKIPYLTPVSEHRDQTEGDGVKHHPNAHDWKTPLGPPWSSAQKPRCPSGISPPTRSSSAVQFDKWHLQPPVPHARSTAVIPDTLLPPHLRPSCSRWGPNTILRTA